MGIVFVLLIWFILWLGIAMFCSLLLGVLTWRLVRRAKRGSRVRSVLAVVLLPPVCVVSALLGFVCYGVWCETSRGVDAGIGDGWRVPLGSGYQLMMIDTMEHAFIESPNGEQFHIGLPRLGFDEHTVYFETERDVFQLIEKQTGASIPGLSQAELAARLTSLDSPPVNLRPPDRVYMQLRWGAKDLLAIPMVLGVPALLTAFVASYVWKVWRNARQSNTAVA